MKSGIVRRVDDLGRIVIPKEIRRQLFGSEHSEGEPLEMYLEDGKLIMECFKNKDERIEEAISKLEALLLNCPEHEKVGIQSIIDDLKKSL